MTANVVSGPEAQTALRDLPIAWPRQMLANTIEEAGTAATEIGFPIALKSERGLAHRAAAGAVLTGLEDLSTVLIATLTQRGVETVLGIVTTPGVKRPSPRS